MTTAVGSSGVLSQTGGGILPRAGNTGEATLLEQSAHITYTAAATLLATDLTNGLVEANDAGAFNLTLPLVTDLEATLANVQGAGVAIDFSVIGVGAGTATIVTNTGWTLIGAMTVATNTSCRFRARKTGTAAWTLYRIAG